MAVEFSSGATPRKTSRVKGDGDEGQAPLWKKRRDSKSGRAKPQAASRVSGELGRRQAGKQVGRQASSLANLPRRFHFCAPFTRATPTLRGARDSTLVRLWPRCAGTIYLSCTHHTQCVFYRWRTTRRVAVR